MIYIGIDPSYTKTGVSYIDLEDKFILFKAITPEGKNESYIDMVVRAKLIAEEILSIAHHENTIMIEEPLIVSQKASSLGVLSGVLISEMSNHVLVNDIYTLKPNAVSNTNRGLRDYTSKTRKKVSQEMALKYIQVFEDFGYKVVIHNDKNNADGTMRKRKLSSDEAESFIMGIILIRHLKVLDKEIEATLVKTNRGLNANHAIDKLEITKEITNE